MRTVRCEHKDSPHRALGLCSKCYKRKIRRDNGVRPKVKLLVTSCEHTDRPHVAHGLCASCYARHNYRKANPDAGMFQSRETTALTRFMDRVEIQPNGCWFWREGAARKPKSQGSYPMFTDVVNYGKSPMHAVKWAYENIRGLEAPKRGSGLELSHTCESGGICVRPDHVTTETHQENMDRVPKDVKRRIVTNARAHNPRVGVTPGVVTCPHSDRAHYAHGLCRSCYEVCRQKERFHSDPVYREKKLAKCRAYHKRILADPTRKASRNARQRAYYHEHKT